MAITPTLTYLDLQNRVLRWLDEADSTSTHTSTRIKEALNAAQRRLYYSKPWPFAMWPNEETVTTVAGTRVYALHPSVGKIRSLWSDDDGNFASLLPRRQWEVLGINRSTTARVNPSGWTMGPIWPVSAQPTTTGTVSIVSSSTSDTTSRKLGITGISNGNIEVGETLTANGTTPVTSTFSYSHILSASIQGSWVGTCTFKDNAGNTMLALTTGVESRDYPTIEAAESPAGSRVYRYTFLRRCPEMVNDGDLPAIKPNDLSEVLVYDTLLDETSYNTEMTAQALSVFNKRREELWKQLCDTHDDQILGAYPRTVRDLDAASLPRYIRE